MIYRSRLRKPSALTTTMTKVEEDETNQGLSDLEEQQIHSSPSSAPDVLNVIKRETRSRQECAFSLYYVSLERKQ